MRSLFNAEPETIEQNLKRIDELGGTKCYNHYPVGWAMAGDTPFKWYKQYTHNGGVKDPLIVHWPKGIKDKGKIRTQFHHAIDIIPTILEAIGVEPPSHSLIKNRYWYDILLEKSFVYSSIFFVGNKGRVLLQMLFADICNPIIVKA
jgi:N-sulphoglucosamine sulphohydrolase, C-terminal